MSFTERKTQYVQNKNDLPEDEQNSICPICLTNIDPDGKTSIGMPNCVMCVNGHRLHKEHLNDEGIWEKCYDGLPEPKKCPICNSTEPFVFCKSRLGYGYIPRKGGKKISGKKTARHFRKYSRKHPRRKIWTRRYGDLRTRRHRRHRK